MPNIEKAKNHEGKTIFPVTVSDAVLMGNGQTLKGKLSELGQKAGNKYLVLEWIDGYITSDGKFYEDTGYVATEEYYPVYKGQKLYCNLVTLGTYSGIAFYNQDKDFQSSVQKIIKGYIWEAPSNGYVRFCNRTASNDYPSVENLTDIDDIIFDLKSKLPYKLDICYSASYLNIKESDGIAELTSNVYLFADSAEITIPKGNYTLLQDSNQMLVYDESDNTTKFVNERQNIDRCHVIAVIRRESESIRVVSSSLPVKYNGEDYGSKISNMNERINIIQSSRICMSHSSGYVNFDNTNLVAKLSAKLWITLGNSEFSVDSSDIAYNFTKSGTAYALAYNTVTTDVEFVEIRSLTSEHHVLILFRRNENVVTSIISTGGVECRIDGVNLLTRINDLSNRVELLERNILSVEWVDGVITNEGKFYEDTGYVATEGYYHVIKGQRIYCNLVTLGTYSGVAFYNNEKVFQSGVQKVTKGYIWEAPEDGYVRFCNRTASNATPSVEFVSTMGDKLLKVEEDIKELKAEDAKKMAHAASYEHETRSRENALRTKFADSGESAKWYGIKWTEETNANNVTAVNSIGDEALHESLPIQSKMRRCVYRNGIVQYYLDNNNSELKEDGTKAVLDGTDGDVMVEIPEFFYRHEKSDENGVIYHTLKLSEQGLSGFHYMPKRYTSAYQATIDNISNSMASVCTTLFERAESEISIESSSRYVVGNGYSLGMQRIATRSGFSANAARYRGSNNDSSLDIYTDPSDADYSKNQLGLPLCMKTRTDLRRLVKIDEGQFVHMYDTYRAIWMLCMVEFKTRNIQTTIMGMGSTVYPDYESYKGYFIPNDGSPCVPCGVTNSLGNGSGQVYYRLVNVPVSSTGSINNKDWIPTQYGDVWMPVMSYRGIEQLYGQLYNVIDQITIKVIPNGKYVEGYDSGQWWLADVEYWYQSNPYLVDDGETGYLGSWEFAPDTKIVSKLMLGEFMHILPIESDGGDRTLNYCDAVEWTHTNRMCYLAMNGRAVSGTLSGLSFFQAIGLEEISASFGARFDFVCN